MTIRGKRESFVPYVSRVDTVSTDRKRPVVRLQIDSILLRHAIARIEHFTKLNDSS